MRHIPVTVETEQTYNVTVQTDESFELSADFIFERSDVEDFDGAYTYTPTQEEQVINIDGKKATQNITINPIPNNYGLITWNGSVITVS